MLYISRATFGRYFVPQMGRHGDGRDRVRADPNIVVRVLARGGKTQRLRELPDGDRLRGQFDFQDCDVPGELNKKKIVT